VSGRSAQVVVVGAGPAGAVTALLLARAGHDVALLDRALFPRPKPCGDCLSAAATGLLERLGLLPEVEAAAPAQLRGWRIHAPSGEWFDGAFPPAGAAALALPRERLDSILARAAERAGALLLQGVRVTGVERDGAGAVTGVAATGADGRPLTMGARLVVGADGLRSVVARRLDLVRRAPRLRKLSLTAHARGPVLSGARGEMHVIDGACLGLAAVEAGTDPLCNLTLVVDAARFGAGAARDPLAFFHAMLTEFPALRGRLERLRLEPHADGRMLLASGPFDWTMRHTVLPGAALVGDAAGYYDPFTGQGIFQALAGAELLAAEADAALRAGQRESPLLREYARERQRRVRGARILQRVVEAVLSRPRLANAAIAHLRRSRKLADAVVAVTGDLTPATALLRPSLLLTFLGPPGSAEVVG
jgi:flavin-dependent dehydrogenase